jgi:hypothetical protein
VPALGAQLPWREVPLWWWFASHAERRPVFARLERDELQLSLDSDLRLPLKDGAVTDETLAAWTVAIQERRLCIRPRALITTMYARLVLSDLFIHGIGGAKYDQLTDAIIERFFGVPAPKFMTATATMQLQPTPPDTLARAQAAEHELGEFRFHPERYIDAARQPELAELAHAKQRLLAQPPPKGERKAWHQALAAINEQLVQALPDVQQRLQAQWEALSAQLQRERILGSREFSFCLFDERLPQELKRLAEHP